MKKAIKTAGRVVLYKLLNDRTDSRVKCLGYELAILTETGKVKEGWNYETTELRWARAGYATLIDAQNRNVLEHRNIGGALIAERPIMGCPAMPLALESSVSLLQRVLSSRSTQPASSALLL